MDLRFFPKEKTGLFHLFLRKLRSFVANSKMFATTSSCYAAAFGNPSITIEPGCHFAQGVLLKATDGGSIYIGAGVNVSAGVQITAQGGDIIISDGVFIGIGTVIMCKERISIGRDTLIAEYVVIRDQDHAYSKRPIKNAGFQTAPIAIGEDCWCGCKSTFLRGAIIGNGAIIGAHSLVRGTVPAFTLAAGCPAQIKKELPTA